MKNYVLFNNSEVKENKLHKQLDIMQENKIKLGYYETFSNYIDICDWMIRRQEYNFTIDVFEDYEMNNSSKKLKVLDLGCGVVPLCNYIGLKNHEVIALDPIENDINFLIKNDLNSIHESNVNFLHGYGEKLPFEDNSFDVVYSVSVLEHIASGNDLIVISEMLRVLKIGGRLILTTDVMPKEDSNERNYASPFTSSTLPAVFDFINNYGIINAENKNSLVDSLENLTWEHVHSFWIDSKKSDQRKEEQREYLAVGFFLDKTKDFNLEVDQKIDLFLQGQNRLINGFYFYQNIATIREKDMIEKEKVIEELKQYSENIKKELDFYKNNLIVKILKKLGLIK